MLKIKLIGKSEIWVDESEISAKISSKGFALLGILAMEKHKEISRQELISLLWSMSTEDAARYNLRYNLWQLRKLLPLDENGESFLIVNKEYCKINSEYKFQCDLLQIMEADIPKISDIDQLEKLNELLKGDFFENHHFPGCEILEEKIIMQRYYLERKKLEILKKLIELYESKGLDIKCMSSLIECEKMDPYDEKIAIKRLTLLLKKEKHKEAMNFYQRFCSGLVRDLGIEPSEEIKNLGKNIRSIETARSTVYHIETYCVSSVECFWMSQVLKKIAEIKEINIESYLSSNKSADLSYIQITFGDKAKNVSLARVADSFIELIENICLSNKRLEIKVHNMDNMDVVSKDILKLLKIKCGNHLIIKAD